MEGLAFEVATREERRVSSRVRSLTGVAGQSGAYSLMTEGQRNAQIGRALVASVEARDKKTD
jgi:hypothetical protein